MNKCPHCGAVLKTLTRICEACGSEIKSEASATAQSASASTPPPSAAEVCTKIQDDLALLATRPSASRLAAFLTGLITLPTLGLGYLAVKAVNVFGSPGKSPARAKLSLEQNLRVVENSYKADSDVRTLVEKGKNELASYLRRQHSSRMAFLTGIVASIVLALAATGAVILHQKHIADEASQKAIEADNKRIHDQEVLAAAAKVVAAENHKQAVSMANSIGADVSYKAGILVDNKAGIDLADKVSILEDKLNSSLAGKGFATTALRNIDNLDVASQQFVAVAQNSGVNFIVHASISSFGSQKKVYTGNDVSTENYIYTLRVAYQLIEAGEGHAITGDTVTATKQIRQSAGLQTDSNEVISELLDDAAGQIVAAFQKYRTPPATGTGKN